jgi:hypothetical protein
MIGAYTIWVDGLAYGGESEETEPAPAATGQWWLQSPVTTRNRLKIGEGAPHLIEGWRTLGSHLERLMARHRDGLLPFTEITIRTESPHA